MRRETPLCPARLAPAEPPAHCGVARRHRLAVKPELTPEPPRYLRLGVCERHLLCADPAPHQRHRTVPDAEQFSGAGRWSATAAKGKVVRNERGLKVGQQVGVRLGRADVARGFIDFARI